VSVIAIGRWRGNADGGGVLVLGVDGVETDFAGVRRNGLARKGKIAGGFGGGLEVKSVGV